VPDSIGADSKQPTAKKPIYNVKNQDRMTNKPLVLDTNILLRTVKEKPNARH
jgi:hypothetical protein